MTPKRLLAHPNLILVALLALFTGLAACDDDNGVVPDWLEEEDLVGTYDATTLIVTEDGTDRDVLADGGELTLVLNSDDTVSGQLFIPEETEGEGDVDETLDGTWNFQDLNDNVTLELTNVVFLDGLTFDASETGGQAELRAEDEEVGDTTVTVILVQQ